MFTIEVPQVLANKTYTESPQNNPMQWRWMYRTKNKLTAQAGWMRCKDFFNDLVALKQGHTFSVYNLSTEGLKFNKYGLYVELNNVLADTLIANIETAINPRMQQDLGAEIKCWKQDDTRVVIRIPHVVFDSTYRTSLTTMLIRLSNYDVRFESFEDFYTQKSAIGKTEHSMNVYAQKLTKHFGFKLPKDEWYYSMSGYRGSSDKNIIGQVIHNNGMSDWANTLHNEDFTY